MKGKNKRYGFLIPVVLVVLVLLNAPLSSLGASLHTAHLAGPRSPVPIQQVYTGDSNVQLVVEVLVVAVVVLAVAAALQAQEGQFEKSKLSRQNRVALAHAEFDR